MANYIVSDSSLGSVADAIRTKGGISSPLVYPDGFVSAIQDISGGGANVTWFGAQDAELLHEATYEVALEDMTNWGSLTPSTSQQNLKYPATAYSTSGGNTVAYGRYGRNYGTSDYLSLTDYSYWVVNEAFSHIEYTVDEASLGIRHNLRNCSIVIYQCGAAASISSGAVVYPTDNTTKNLSSVTFSLIRGVERMANGQLNTMSTYGAYISSYGSVTNGSSSSGGNTFISYFSFTTPSYYLREHATYFPSSLWQYVDASASGVKCRARVYRAKRPAPVEVMDAYTYRTAENNAFVDW